MHLKKLFSLGLISVLLATSLPFLSAQENIQLVVSYPEWMGDIFKDELFDAFEAEHPGVEVVLREGDQDTSFITPPGYDVEQFLKGTEAITTSADVFFANEIPPAATQAGFYLNLDPLVRADTSLNPDDFYPAVWQAYQWDGGIWALPVAVDLNFIVYQPSLFDEAGLSYPSPDWTLDDYAVAAEALTQYDEDGAVTLPGLMTWNTDALLRAMFGRSFVDDSQFPATPYFTDPEFVALATRWKELMDAGVIGYPQQGTGPDTEYGMALGGVYDLEAWQGSTGRQAVLLPGNVAIANVQGFAVSAGTQYPELAYDLAKYLTNAPTIAYQTGGTPARISLKDAELPEDMPMFRPEYSAETQAFLDEAMAQVLTPADMRYHEYIGRAFFPGEEGGEVTDIEAVLAEAEVQANADIQTAIERRNSLTLVVTPPDALPELAPGEIGLKFGLFVNMSPMPNRDAWEAFAAEFAANDPEVGYVQIDPSFGGMDHPATLYDCFYAERWYIENAPEENLISLDPFMAADPGFDPNDFVQGSLAALRGEDEQTWAYPILISPRVLSYNTVLFDNAGLPYPTADWTVSDFVDTLRALQSNGAKPFSNADWSPSYLYMLIAAYGGIPFNPTAEDVALHLTDSTNFEAIRQVLDLAKEGLIDYQRLANAGGGGGGGFGGPDGPALMAQMVSDIDWAFGNPDAQEFENPYVYVNYPRGSSYVPVSYDVKGAYISNQSQSPEACYRFISAITQHPELFSGMPARYSTIDMITDSRADLFRQYAETLQDPNTVLISPNAFSTESYVASYLMGRAFDRYVLEDADLQAELESAEIMAADIITCMKNLNLPELDPETATEEDWQAQFNQQRECALNVDPTLEDLFPSFE